MAYVGVVGRKSVSEYVSSSSFLRFILNSRRVGTNELRVSFNVHGIYKTVIKSISKLKTFSVWTIFSRVIIF